LPNLKSLKLYGIHEKFEVIAPNLKTLVVRFGILTNEMLENYPNLTHLEFTEDYCKNQRSLIQISTFPTKLKFLEIKLEKKSQCEINLLELLEVNLGTLKKINLWTENKQNEIEFALYKSNVETLGVKVPKEFKFTGEIRENVKDLTLNSFYYGNTLRIIQTCPKVEKLTVFDEEGTLDCDILLEAVNMLSNLRNLTVKKYSLSDLEEVLNFPQIEFLTLAPTEIEAENYVNFILSCKNIKKLQLDRPYYCDTLSSQDMIKILENLKELEEISANYVVELSNEVVDFIIHNNLKLKRMNLAVYTNNLKKQKELSLKLSRNTKIQCVITEVTDKELSDGM
jgi:hypothetical protein